MRQISGIHTDEIKHHIGNKDVAVADAYPISTYRELIYQVAKLSYLNKDYLLFFRGQDRDYRNKANSSTFYPSIYRGDPISKQELDMKFDFLSTSSRKLCDVLKAQNTIGYQDVRRRKLIQWSILQHYEVWPTPLLDFTHSLRVACSFAFLRSNSNDPYVFVFGLPYLTNRISNNSEHDLVNIRLLSICPPDALRPHFQEGYLAGTDDITNEYDNKNELDFNNRLVAKFRLKSRSFWNEGFSPTPESALYPHDDMFESICKQLKAESDSYAGAEGIGSFLQLWNNLENVILNEARNRESNIYSVRQAMDTLLRSERIQDWYWDQLNNLRMLRNRVVHQPSTVRTQEIYNGISQIQELLRLR
jgi:hypothetical protein